MNTTVVPSPAEMVLVLMLWSIQYWSIIQISTDTGLYSRILLLAILHSRIIEAG